MTNYSPDLMIYLAKWFTSTVLKQEQAGNKVDLSFDEWLDLFSDRQITTLSAAIAGNRLGSLQHEDNEYALVASWKSYAARSTNVYDKDTAIICSRQASATINLPQKGDKLRASHVENVAKALTGVAKTEEHCQNISEGKKGQPIAGWSPDRKAAKSEAMKASHAKRKAEKEAVRKAAEEAAWARLAAKR